MKKSFALLCVCLLCLALALCACGGKESAQPQDDAGFSMKALEGVYTEEYAHRGVLVLTAVDEQTATIAVRWPGSAASAAYWEMTARYDAEKQLIVYDDAVLIEKTYAGDGSESDRVVYTHGTGSLNTDHGKLVWTDDAEEGNGTSTFIYEMSLAEYAAQTDAQDAPTPSVAPVIVTPTPAPSAAPTATPAPSATPAPDGLPIIKKSPTDETVKVGGSCMFVAKYENATWAVWHFVSPDGQTDMTYEAAAERFPTMEIVNGMYSTMTLKNVPADLNGWRVYCRYTNKTGSADTKTALITVTGTPEPTPAPTPAPTTAPLGPVVNEWVETTDLSAAVSGSGVKFTPPLEQALPEGLSLKTYRYQAGIIEASYVNDKDETVLTIRKSNTVGGTDLSGDHNSYSHAWDQTLKGVKIHCLGDGSTSNTTHFDAGEDHFAISYNIGKEGKGLTGDQLNSLINGMQ